MEINPVYQKLFYLIVLIAAIIFLLYKSRHFLYKRRKPILITLLVLGVILGLIILYIINFVSFRGTMGQ